MEKLFTKPWLRAFSGLFVNFSAGYFGLTFIAPNYLKLTFPNAAILLTFDITLGIVFLVASVKVEELLEKL